MSFDSFINAVIPWVVGITGIFLLYKPLKGPINELFGAIGKMVGWGKNKINPRDEEGGVIDIYKGIDYV